MESEKLHIRKVKLATSYAQKHTHTFPFGLCVVVRRNSTSLVHVIYWKNEIKSCSGRILQRIRGVILMKSDPP